MGRFIEVFMAISFIRSAEISSTDLLVASLPYVGVWRGYTQIVQYSAQAQSAFVSHVALDFARRKVVVYSLAAAVSLFSTALLDIAIAFFCNHPFPWTSGVLIGLGCSYCYRAYQMKDIQILHQNAGQPPV